MDDIVNAFLKEYHETKNLVNIDSTPRTTVINFDDVLNVKILLNITTSVDEFLTKI